jgi:hypothetical protein
MKKNYYFFVLIFTFLLSGCGLTSTQENLDEEIIKVIKSDETAINTRDVDLAISNYSSKNLTNEIKQLQTETFKNFENLKLSLKTHDIEVIYVKKNEAVVKTLNKYRTPTFNPDNNFQNDNNMLHFFIKEDGNWKFNYSYIVKRVFLNENGSLDLENKKFLGWDESKIWDERIKKMKEQNALPSQFLEENPLD